MGSVGDVCEGCEGYVRGVLGVEDEWRWERVRGWRMSGGGNG